MGVGSRNGDVLQIDGGETGGDDTELRSGIMELREIGHSTANRVITKIRDTNTFFIVIVIVIVMVMLSRVVRMCRWMGLCI